MVTTIFFTEREKLAIKLHNERNKLEKELAEVQKKEKELRYAIATNWNRVLDLYPDEDTESEIE